MSYRRAHQHLTDAAVRLENERARMRQFMIPGKGYRVNFWRRMARAILRAIT